MRILLVHDGHEFGGLERIMVDTARELGGRHRIAVLVRGPSYEARRSAPAFVAALRDAGAEIVEIDRGDRRARVDVHRFRSLVRSIRHVDPDVVHVHTVKVESCHDVVAASRLARVPMVLRTEHNSPSAFSKAAYRSFRRRLFDRMTTAVVTVSEHDRVEQVDVVGRSASRVVCIRNGVDTARFTPLAGSSPRRGRADRSPLTVVGTAGRLSDQKAHRDLVDAMAIVCRSRNDIRARIAGEGTLRGALEAQVSDRGLAQCVELVGQVDDSARFFADVDIGVMPSRHEGLSLTLLEMMSMGIPTIVSDHPGLTEAAVDGVTSLVVPIGDPPALAAALTALADDPARQARFGAAARERIEKQFSARRYFADLEALYVGRTSQHDRRLRDQRFLEAR